MEFDVSEKVVVPVEQTSMAVTVDVGAATHCGRQREINEDSCLVACASRSLETLFTNLQANEISAWAVERAYAMLVADGMGGEAAGEVASHLALRAVVEHILRTPDWILRDTEAQSARIEKRISERFAAANDTIKREAARNPEWSGMGTTMTLAASSGNRLFLGHVGDSRAYLLRENQLQLLTCDHTFAQSLADAGMISQESVETHHMRNVLVSFLGSGAANADIQQLLLESGDQLLLCTDGLTDMVAESVISSTLQTSNTPQIACQKLVEAALEAGGKDNVTVVLAKYAWKAG
jgi:protein phosphatase